MEVWKIIFLSKWLICRFRVNLPGCRGQHKIPPIFYQEFNMENYDDEDDEGEDDESSKGEKDN